LLEQDVSVEAVAMLLGNTPAIVVKHYSPWIRSRQRILEAAVQTTWQTQKTIAQANGADTAASPSETMRLPLLP
jgi:hypothetical protein